MIAAKIMRSESFKISVIGSGAWGTAFVRLLANNGSRVQPWCHEAENSVDILAYQLNSSFLADVPLLETGTSADLAEVVQNCKILVASVPSHFSREIAKIICPEITDEHIIVILKGIEEHSLAMMIEIYANEFEHLTKSVVLSGPTFGCEVALDLSSATLLV